LRTCTKREFFALSAATSGRLMTLTCSPPSCSMEYSFTPPLTPPATARCAGSSPGANAICQFSAGGVSMTHRVSWVSTLQTRMRESSAEDATSPFGAAASATTPRVCPV